MLKNILLRLLNLLSIMIILFSCLILLNVIMTRSGEVPSFMGYSLFRVMTGSMEPTIPTDSLIIVKKVSPSELAVGDVISFYSRDPELWGAINTHRITEIVQADGRYVFQTKGDANAVADSHATLQEDVIGKVIHSSVLLGKVVKLLSNPLIFVPLIMIPLVIMLSRNIWDGFVLARKLAQEEEEAAVREAVESIRQRQAQQKQSEESQGQGNQKENKGQMDQNKKASEEERGETPIKQV